MLIIIEKIHLTATIQKHSVVIVLIMVMDGVMVMYVERTVVGGIQLLLKSEKDSNYLMLMMINHMNLTIVMKLSVIVEKDIMVLLLIIILRKLNGTLSLRI